MKSVALNILIAAGCFLLTGCVGLVINDVEFTPQGLARLGASTIIKTATRGVRSSMASGRAQRLINVLKEKNIQPGEPLPADVVAVIEVDYQKVLDDIVGRIREIQKNAKGSDGLAKKGLMRATKLVVVNEGDQINAWSRDDVLRPAIYIPSSLITRSLLRLQAEQDSTAASAKDIFSKAFVGFTTYVPYLEFEELMRLVLAHEATHIWLHEPGLDIRGREIEADAWGVALSTSLSEVFSFRAKAGRMALSGGFTTTDPFDMSLMSSRFGFEVLDYLYGNQGVLAQGDGRQSLEERRKSVEAKYSEVFGDYISSLKDTDVVLFALMRKIL